MHLVLPATRSLRNLYALSSDRFWFILATVAGLIAAGEVVELLLMQNLPPVDMLGL